MDDFDCAIDDDEELIGRRPLAHDHLAGVDADRLELGLHAFQGDNRQVTKNTEHHTAAVIRQVLTLIRQTFVVDEVDLGRSDSKERAIGGQLL